MDPNDLRRRATELLTQAEAVLAEAPADGEPPADLQERHDALTSQAEGLITRAEGLEAMAQRRAEIAARANAGAGATPSTDGRNTRNGRHAYDVTRSTRALALGRIPDGLEGEEHQELSKFRNGTKGVLIPTSAEISYRAFSAAGGTTTMIRGPIINALVDRLVLVQAGVQYISSNGLFKLPKATSGATYWVSNATPNAANRNIDQAAFSVHTVAGKTTIDRQTLTTANVDTQSYMWGQLTKDLGVGLQKGCLHGSGSSGEPLGLFAMTGSDGITVKTPATNGEALDYAKLLALVGAVESANAGDNLGWVTNPSVTAKLEGTAKAANTAAFCYNAAVKTIIDRPAYVTSSVSKTLTQGSSNVCSGVAFGAWAEAVIALFSAIDVFENPYKDDGGNTISAFLDCDFGLIHPAAFAVAKDVLTV